MLSKVEGIMVFFLICALFAAGWTARGWKDGAAERKSEAAAKKETVLLQRGASQADAAFIDRIVAEKDRQHERAQNLEAKLASTGRALSSCRIDAGTLRVLNDEVPGVAGSPAGARSDAAGLGAGSTCAELARAFETNRGAFDLVVAQLGACRSFYLDVKRDYCAATGAC